MGCYSSCPMNKTELKTSKPAAAEVLNFFLQDFATSDMSSPSLVHKLKGTWASLSSITLVIFTSTSIWTSHRKDIGSSLQSSISIRHQTPCSSLIGNLLKTSINIDFHDVRSKRPPNYTNTPIFLCALYILDSGDLYLLFSRIYERHTSSEKTQSE